MCLKEREELEEENGYYSFIGRYRRPPSQKLRIKEKFQSECVNIS